MCRHPKCNPNLELGGGKGIEWGGGGKGGQKTGNPDQAQVEEGGIGRANSDPLPGLICLPGSMQTCASD